MLLSGGKLKRRLGLLLGVSSSLLTPLLCGKRDSLSQESGTIAFLLLFGVPPVFNIIVRTMREALCNLAPPIEYTFESVR